MEQDQPALHYLPANVTIWAPFSITCAGPAAAMRAMHGIVFEGKTGAAAIAIYKSGRD